MNEDLNFDDLCPEVFAIEEKDLIFKTFKSPKENTNLSNSSVLNVTHNPVHMGESQITVTNLTSDFIAFRTKSTRKKYYTVSPTYCVISPNNFQKISFNYFINHNEAISNNGHKFKFEGFIIPSSDSNRDAKSLFATFILNKRKVVGNSIIKNVNFIEEDKSSRHSSLNFSASDNANNEKNKLNNIVNNSLTSSKDKNEENEINNDILKNNSGNDVPKKMDWTLRGFTSTPTKQMLKNSSTNFLPNYYNRSFDRRGGISLDDEEEKNKQLEHLKVEYFKLKNELNNLINSYNNMKNYTDTEQNNEEKMDINKENEQNEKNEIKISKLICFSFCIAAVIFGFYLA